MRFRLRTLLRPLLLLSVMVLLLTLALTAVLISGFLRYETFSLSYRTGDDPNDTTIERTLQHRGVYLMSYKGGLRFGSSESTTTYPEGLRLTGFNVGWGFKHTAEPLRDDVALMSPFHHLGPAWLGLYAYRSKNDSRRMSTFGGTIGPSRTQTTDFAFAGWWLLLLPPLPMWALWRWWKRARFGPAHCQHRGYDLRGSTVRCPECGTAVASNIAISGDRIREMVPRCRCYDADPPLLKDIHAVATTPIRPAATGGHRCGRRAGSR